MILPNYTSDPDPVPDLTPTERPRLHVVAPSHEDEHAERLIDAGYRIVGGLLIPQIAERFADQVDPEHIHDETLRTAAEVALELMAEFGVEVDAEEWGRRVQARTRHMGSPNHVRLQLADCFQMPATATSMTLAIQDLRDEAMRAAAAPVIRRLTSRLTAGTHDQPTEAIAAACQDLEAVQRRVGGGQGPRLTMADLFETDPCDVVDDIIPTEIPWMDAALPGGGLRRGDVVLIGGAPGLGKTSLALTIELGCLLAHPEFQVTHVAVEMSESALRTRCMSNLSRLTEGVLRRPWDELSPMQVEAKTRAKEIGRDALKRMAIELPPVTPRTIRDCVRRNRPDLLVIDYLQIVGTDEPTASRREAVDAVMRTIREIASREGLIALVLSEAAKPPKGGDLDMWSAFKESSGLIYAADLAYVGKDLSKKEDDAPALGIRTGARIDWECHKARHGQRVDIQTWFDGSIARFDAP